MTLWYSQFWHIWGNFGTRAVGLKGLGQPGKFQMQFIGPQIDFTKKSNEDLEASFKDISGRKDVVFKSFDWNTEWR